MSKKKDAARHHEPLLYVTKRDHVPLRTAILARAIALAVAVVV